METVRLAKGMSQEEVLKLIGSPSNKILMEQKELWGYSGYSLLFESRVLKDIR